MRKGLRKTYQKQFNKKLREVNKQLAADDLWQGRFIFLQKDSSFEKFSDNSGGILYLTIRGYDKKTGYYKDYHLEYAPYLSGVDWHLFADIVNHFIVEDCDVWRKEDVRNNREDFTKVKVNVEKLMAAEVNWFLSEEYAAVRVK